MTHTKVGTEADLIAEIEHGHYAPRPYSVGALLLDAFPDAFPEMCRHCRIRSLRIFARLALRREGLFWPMTLEADHASLSDDDAQYIAECWRQWLLGTNPFREGRRRVIT